MIFTVKGERDGDLILADAAGETAVFEFLEMAVVDGREYAALLQRGETEVTLLRLLEDGGKERYEVIEDDAEFSAVLAAFDALFSAED